MLVTVLASVADRASVTVVAFVHAAPPLMLTLPTGPADSGRGCATPVTPVATFPAASTAHSRYAYAVPLVRPACTYPDVALADATVPTAQLAGATVPVAYTTLYPATVVVASVAAVHVSVLLAFPYVTVSTPPVGATVSNVMLACAVAADTFPHWSRNFAYTVLTPCVAASVYAFVVAYASHAVHVVVALRHMSVTVDASVADSVNVTAATFVTAAPPLMLTLPTGPTASGFGIATVVTPAATFPAASMAHSRYAYVVPLVRPVCVYVSALPSYATVPVAQLAGATVPVANTTRYFATVVVTSVAAVHVSVLLAFPYAIPTVPPVGAALSNVMLACAATADALPHWSRNLAYTARTPCVAASTYALVVA
jgi:hypothetical protein